MARDDDTPEQTQQSDAQENDRQQDDQPGVTADDKGPNTSDRAAAANNKNDGFAQLRDHHKSLRALIGEGAKTTHGEDAEDVLERLTGAWTQHVERSGILYDDSTDAGLQEFPLLADIAIDSDLVSFLLLQPVKDLDDPLRLATLRVASRLIGEIIDREEKPRSGLFAKAKAAGVDPAALGRRVGARTTTLSDPDSETLPRLRHLTAYQEDIMPRNSNMPDRDERGRFVSDDDHDGRQRRSSGRYDDDRERDSRGRFMSDRDDDRGRSRYGRDDDDDRRGYSRASRYDDDRERDSRGRFMSDRDDDRGRSRYGRDDDDDRRGYSRASRYDDDRERDSRGRFMSDRDDDRGRSRYGRDDDDRRRSSGRYDDDDRDSQGQGWFGDSRGHSQAARLGWDRRRDDDDDDRRYPSRGRR